MHKLFNFIAVSLFVSCSGISKIKKTPEFYTNKITVHPGKVVQVFLPNHFEGKSITCNKKDFIVVNEVNEPFFIYAESYFSDMKPKKCQAENTRIEINVEDKVFPFEELKVDRKRVNLNKKDLERVIKERQILKKVYSDKSRFLQLMQNFELPLNSKITSEYGKRRLYNKERKGQHLGIDFRAKVGKEITSANDGVVVLARDLFYTGNTVIIYHGYNIYTVYGHLSKINVKKHSKISKGQTLGLAGMTGRVTGPHLHWGVKVNGQWVDGKDLLSLNFLD